MKDIKLVIADNLTYLRKSSKLTQLELAEKMNYSDKAISKWERGESLPDILTLKSLADMYGVTIDYLMQEHSQEDVKNVKKNKGPMGNKIIITLLSCLVVWICATIVYVNLIILLNINYWMIWLWAIPLSAILLIIFSSIWGNRNKVIISITILIWSLLICFHIQFIRFNIWSIYLIGIPIQIALILWTRLKPKNK